MSHEDRKEADIISHYTIWNDIGYPIIVEPKVIGVHPKDILLKQNIKVQPGEKKDLSLEWVRTGLEKAILDVKIEHPIFGEIPMNGFEIADVGTAKREIEISSEEKYNLISHVYHHKHKKFIRFTSPIIIENTLQIPIILCIHDLENQKKYTTYTVGPSASYSIPFDMLNNFVSFHREGEVKPFESIKFYAYSLPMAKGQEIPLGNCFGYISHRKHRYYDLVTIVPSIIVKNALPFSIAVEIHGQGPKSKTDSLASVIAVKEELQVINFDTQTKVTMVLVTNTMESSEYILNPPRANQELVFRVEDRKCKIIVYKDHQRSGGCTKYYSLVADTCVFNMTPDPLLFLGSKDYQNFSYSPFVFPTLDGRLVTLFNDISAIRARYEKFPGSTETIRLDEQIIQASISVDEKKMTDLSIVIEDKSFGNIFLI